MANSKAKIAVLGGTGDLGWGLALQLARAGYPVIVGSRQAEKGERAAAELKAAAPEAEVRGTANPEAAAAADIVIMTVPYASQLPTLESVRDQVQGKIFVDATVPLVPPKVMRVQLPEGGSAAKQTQEFLGEGVRVVSAFQNVAAEHLRSGSLSDEECDVLVCGNDPDARQAVVELAEAIGLRAWHAGPIDNSAVAEGLTSILIFLNKRYKLDGAGIRITGHVRG
ncbi:MAG: NADPH-dependent F420 reductase [Gammaproteobacteria bacterium]|nr:MAG: NADPH-dependent F420 reductase [Gammaproteobacteria bacterium]